MAHAWRMHGACMAHMHGTHAWRTQGGWSRHFPYPQGVWAEGTKPPWACDLHLNVNLQMAYWPAGPTGLYPEAAVPLAGFLRRLAQSGQRVARLYYGATQRGAWVAHGFTDAWARAAPLGPPAWALCVVCGAWAALSLWAAFEYTREVARRR